MPSLVTHALNAIPVLTSLVTQEPNPLASPPGGGAGGLTGAGTTPGGVPAGGGGGTGASRGLFDNSFMIMVMVGLGLLILMSTFTGRKQRKQRETMLSALRKHDRVMTSGGIIGSVVELKPKWVVLKVDESSNTRITFSRESIQQVLEESTEPAAAENKS